jgi:hypothetical protein
MFHPLEVGKPGEGMDAQINFKKLWLCEASNCSGLTGSDYTWPTFLGDAAKPDDYHGANLSGNSCAEGRTSGCGWIGELSYAKGNWLRSSHYIKGSEDPTQGKVKLWEMLSTGIKLKHNKVGNTLGPGDYWTRITIPGYGRTGGPPAQVVIDDIYVAEGQNAQARVEIGNSSDYMSCTKMTILTPTVWGPSSIQATVNQGQFAAGESAYLFVVNSAGEVSPGKSITFGASVADTTGPILGDPSIPYGATGIAPNTPFTVPADENLDCTTSTASTINPHPVAATCIGNTLTHTPTGQSYNTTYTVTITTALKDVAGNPMDTQRTFTYTTAIDEGTVIEEECSQDNWHLCTTLEEVNAANAAGVPEKTIYFWKNYSRTIPEPSFSSNIVTQTNLAAPYTGTPSGWETYTTATAAEYGTYLANGQQIYWPNGILDNSTMVWAINILPGNVGQLHVASSISGINLSEPGTHIGTIIVGEIADHGWYLSTVEGPNAVTINGPVLAELITTKFSLIKPTGIQMKVKSTGVPVKMVQ